MDDTRFLSSQEEGEQIRKIIHLLERLDATLSLDKDILPYLDIATVISWIEKSETQEGYSGDYLEALEAIFSTLKNDRELPYLKGLIHNFKRINSGSYGKIYLAQDRENRSLFLVKRNDLSDTNRLDYLSAFYHEVYVGRYLNFFRRRNPGIVQTFGSISCESPLFHPGTYLVDHEARHLSERHLSDAASYCPGYGESSEHYILLENVTDRGQKQSSTLYQFLGKGEQEPVFAYSLLLQIFNTLATINTMCEFTHNDLHFGNILIQSVDDVAVFVRKPEGGFETISVNHVPRIIDCANAYLKDEHGEFAIANEAIGTVGIHCPFRDFVKVIFGFYEFAKDYANETFKKILELIYANSGRRLSDDFYRGRMSRDQQIVRGLTDIFSMSGGYLTEEATRKYAHITLKDIMKWTYRDIIPRQKTPFSSACAIEPGCTQLANLRVFFPEANPAITEAQRMTDELTGKLDSIEKLKAELLSDAIAARERLLGFEGYNENKNKYAIVKLEALIDEILVGDGGR